MAGHAKAATDRCPSWRQLYRLTATLCETAGIAPPQTSVEASALIERLDALTGEGAAAPVETAKTVSDDCPF